MVSLWGVTTLCLWHHHSRVHNTHIGSQKWELISQNLWYSTAGQNFFKIAFSDYEVKMKSKCCSLILNESWEFDLGDLAGASIGPVAFQPAKTNNATQPSTSWSHWRGVQKINCMSKVTVLSKHLIKPLRFYEWFCENYVVYKHLTLRFQKIY